MDWDFAKFMGGFIAFSACVIAAVIGVVALGESWQCAGYREATGKQTKYIRLECHVNDGGAWYSWAEYKNRLIAKGQMAH